MSARAFYERCRNGIEILGLLEVSSHMPWRPEIELLPLDLDLEGCAGRRRIKEIMLHRRSFSSGLYGRH
jgi:hypothetical protein